MSLFVFSEFLNLDEVEKDKRFKVNFLKRNPQQKKFIVDDVNSVLTSLKISLDRAKDFEMFINGINKFLSEQEFLNIQLKNKKKLCWVYVIMALFFLGILIMGSVMYFLYYGRLLFMLEGVVEIIFIILLILKIVDAYHLKILFKNNK
mgnify:FL=1